MIRFRTLILRRLAYVDATAHSSWIRMPFCNWFPVTMPDRSGSSGAIGGDSRSEIKRHSDELTPARERRQGVVGGLIRGITDTSRKDTYCATLEQKY